MVKPIQWHGKAEKINPAPFFHFSLELITVWEDPDFDPEERAFYYARVIEIPTPRWTAYDQLRFGTTMSDEVPMTTQERAYTSPIWYTP